LEIFVVSENVLSNDTINAGAQVLLPATAWGEKDGTVTNSERRISRQRAFLPLPGEAQPDWWIVAEVARRMGFKDAFAYASAADVFREHAALSCFENKGARDFDLGALATISDAEFDTLDPVQWPVRAGSASDDQRFFAEGGFFTPDRKARFVAPESPALKDETSPAYPLRLNTGRIRDQWHTMTRTGLSPRLASHLPEPFVEVHPEDAEAVGLVAGGFAKVTSAHGACVMKVAVSGNQQRGSLFVPIHWSSEFASSACVGDLVAPHTDPHSGQPEAKATAVAIASVSFPLRGIAHTQQPISMPPRTWWARTAVSQGVEYRLATGDGPMLWHDFAYRVLTSDARLAEEFDGRGYRAAALVDGEVESYLCIGPPDVSLRWDPRLLAAMELPDGAGGELRRIDFDMGETGPVICACFQVPAEAVLHAISSGAATTLEDIGRTLRAGTNCGSCLPELKKAIASTLPKKQ
jgi:assimilatory nitrate reductase catalytic subunit